MPYIKPVERNDVQPILDDLDEFIRSRGISEGQLNYLITSLCQMHLKRHGTSYSVINGIIGVLECAKQEFYRRIAEPYENKKRDLNGDVYDDDTKPKPFLGV
jgi:hypothetical protein